MGVGCRWVSNAKFLKEINKLEFTVMVMESKPKTFDKRYGCVYFLQYQFAKDA